MTSPEEAIRRAIDQTVLPRLEDYRTYLAAAGPAPFLVARADLLYVWDEYRTEYLDWATLSHPLGHSHPIVAQAVREHHRYYGHTGPQDQHLHRWPVEYAKQLSRQFTGAGETPQRVLFCEGEREAVAQAVALAAGAHGAAVLTVGGGYDWMTAPRLYYPPVFDPADASWDGVHCLLLNLVDDQCRTMRAGQARRWMLAAREAGKPVIVDETVTGFGRLGRMWGFQSTGLSPDIVVLGGADGGGYPLGAVVASPDLFQNFSIDVSGQAGNPIACSAGAALLTATEMGVLDYMEESGKRLTTGLDEMLAQFGHHLTGHHGEGLLRGMVFADADRARRFTQDCRAQGLYVSPPFGDTVVLAPALVTSTNEMTRGMDLVAATLMVWDDEVQPGHSPEERP